MKKAAPKASKKAKRSSSPRIARPGDIDDGAIALGQVRRLDADVHVLTGIVRDDVKDIKNQLASLADGQLVINVEITNILRALTSIERRLSAHEQQLLAANGAST